jgi:hypothetical protein
MLNASIETYPFELVAAYVALDIASILGVHQALLAAGVEAPADFAVAFALSRLLRRVRVPVDLAVAGVIAKAFPALTQVQITRVFHRVRHAEARPAGGPSGVLTTSDAPIATAGLLNAPADSTVGRVVSAAARLIDRYGLAFLVSQRMVVGLASVFTIYGGLRAGVDVQGWLAAHDLASAGGVAVGNVAGTWAAAACCAAALFPGVVLGAGALAPRLAALRRALWKSGR